ncbi:MAG: 50S ribosomal protein L25 [Deltaproteobacteria bacterium]|nr:50S ribosomal protein L25 [Deltaproteobacteria bacterium]
METSLNAELRQDNFGKEGARKLRASGGLPGVVYGPESSPISITVDPHELDTIFRHSQNRNTVVELQVGDETIPCLVREVQRHPVTRAYKHVDFYRLSLARPVTVMVPVVSVGKSLGASIGGRVRIIRREMKVRCPYTMIPATVPVDVTKMNIGDMVKASEIPAPEGTELLFETDFNVVTIYGKKAGTERA